jgi:hypothetical protein
MLCSDRLGIIEVEFMAAQEFKIGCMEIQVQETSFTSTTSAFTCKKLLNLHQTLSLINITKLEGKCVLSNLEKYPLDIPNMVMSPDLTYS